MLSETPKRNMSVQKAALDFLIDQYPSFIKYVPDQVLEFGVPNRAISSLAGMFIMCLSLASLIGNSLIMYLYFKHSTLRTTSNKLVINLSFSNMLMHTKSWIIIINGFAGGPYLGGKGKENTPIKPE